MLESITGIPGRVLFGSVCTRHVQGYYILKGLILWRVLGF
jgi:hypothetical protein